MKERLQIGIGRYIEVDQTLPALRLTPKRQHIRGVRHSCGGRFKIDRVMVCRLCFYRGKSRVMARCRGSQDFIGISGTNSTGSPIKSSR